MKYIYFCDENFLMHHGIKNQKWGVQNGPPYPLDDSVSTGKRLKINKDIRKIKKEKDKNQKENVKSLVKEYKKNKSFNSTLSKLPLSEMNDTDIKWYINDLLGKYCNTKLNGVPISEHIREQINDNKNKELKNKCYEIRNSKHIRDLIDDYENQESYIYHYGYIKDSKNVHESSDMNKIRNVNALVQYLKDPNPEKYSEYDREIIDGKAEYRERKAKNAKEAIKMIRNDDSIAHDEGDESHDMYRAYLIKNKNNNEKDWNKLSYNEQKFNNQVVDYFNKEMNKIGGIAYISSKEDDFPKIICKINGIEYSPPFYGFLSNLYNNNKISQSEIDKLIKEVETNKDLITD